MAASSRPAAMGASRRFRWPRAGPGRRIAIGVLLGWIAIVGVTIWRMGSLDGLPDVGDPFDVAEARRPIEIPDADNAFVAYRAAHGLLAPANPIDDAQQEAFLDAVNGDEAGPMTWSSAPRGLREYLEAHRPALEIWREGSRRRDAVYHQPGELSVGSSLTLIEDAKLLAGMAALEASRLEEAGAREGARDWYLAMLRCSRLIGRHGVLVQRTFGAMIHAMAARRILRWAADPRLSAGSIRRALRDTLEADALTPPDSEAVRLAYLSLLKPAEDMASLESTMRDFGVPLPLLGGRQRGALDQLLPWPVVSLPVWRVRVRAGNDLERSRRGFRLLFANWLAQAGRPADRRAPLAMRDPIWIYAEDPSAPLAARAVSPEFLAQTLEQTEIGRLLFRLVDHPSDPPWEGRGELVRERRRRSVLIVLAAEVYRREHGAAPATVGALLGTVLQELPEGFTAADPIPDGLE